MSAVLDPARLSLGVDIGGTFTDAVLSDTSGVVAQVKIPTTSPDPGLGFAQVIHRLVAEQQLSDDALELLVHATTVATNAVIEGRSAPVGLIVTRGFRDVLEIARQIRPDLFDLLRQKPPALVPRDRVIEVDERLGPRGEVLRSLDLDSVDAAIDKLRGLEVQGVVICLLHSHANPDHERAVADRVRAELPDLDVSLSSEVWPEFREYFRTTTAVVNAAVRPIVANYVETIRRSLPDFDLRRRFYVMQSGGGVMTADAAARLPVHLIESGPAAGVIGAADLGRRKGWNDLLSLDIGGTTAKVGLIVNGRPRVTHEYEVGAMAAFLGGRSKASGYPIRTPVLDLVEIGAGGGSIAWVDSGGALRVGPRSAGASPGPACYGQGGMAPTLTDANLVLGRIDPKYFLGGEIQLDLSAARDAISRDCAGPLSMSVEDAARGIVDIANANMVRALRLVTVQRGRDPRNFVLVAFGGAGPLHASSLASELQIPTIVIPPSPGVFSAAGLLLAEIQNVVTTTRIQPLAELTDDEIRRSFARIDEQAEAGLEEQGVARHGITVRRFADMRYRGQSYELSIPLPETEGDLISQLTEQFLAEHARQYGHSTRDGLIEVVNWKVYAVAASTRTSGSRPVNLRRDTAGVESSTLANATSVRRGELPMNTRIAGPLIIADEDSTTYVEDGWTAERDSDDIITLRRAT